MNPGPQSDVKAIRILVVEDNPIDRDLFRRLLRRASGMGSFECVESEHGREGLEQFRRVRPACMLLDLNLPDIDGLDLLRSILREPDACPVIVTTAHGSERVAVEAMKAGAADYLVKGSITADSLAHVIRNALEKRALQREVEQQRLAIEEHNRQLEWALEREHAARSAVEQSESRYRTLAEAMPQLVWTADHPNGGWDYVNQRWSRLTGAPASSAFGNGWLDFIDAEDRKSVTEGWDSSRARVVPFELECRISCPNKTSRWQLMRVLPVVQDGRPLKWLGTFTDVDDQRRTEQLLHQRQKLESIGILAGGVAHDFNNLLVGIVGGVSYALDVLPSNHDLRAILEGAFKAGERASHLTRQMLAYAGKASFQIENVDLAQNLNTTWELIQAALPRSIDLKIAIPPNLPPIRTDPAQLQQIIMNLVFNASEAIPADRQGLVVVRAGLERIDGPRSTWGGDLAPGQYVALEVIDNGSGIEPAVISRIFDPFFTTKFTGRGLGLAAVHGIIRSNQGMIDVSSTPGKGSTFRVLLPAGPIPGERSAQGALRAPSPASKACILVVDDESIVRNTAKAILEHSGHAVEIVSSGQGALDRLSGSHGFSLVLLDLSMPGLDGKQTLQAIRRMHVGLPVVICSGYSDSEVRSQFEEGAVSGFLHKPYNLRTLSEKISEILDPG